MNRTSGLVLAVTAVLVACGHIAREGVVDVIRTVTVTLLDNGDMALFKGLALDTCAT